MYDRMLDKQNRPAFDDMAAYCGKSMKLFIRINEWLSEVCETTQEIVFPYGNNYGWAVAHRKKKKLICNVFAENDAFTVMVRLSNEQFLSLYDRMGEETRKCIAGSEMRIMNGRMLFIENRQIRGRGAIWNNLML